MIRIEKLRVDLPGFSLRDVDLKIGPGELFTLLGPTGAGKTLLLEAIGGLVPITRGRIYVGGVEVTDLAPERRGIAIVYQDYALFPHLTVYKNIAYGLRMRREDPATIREKIEWLAGRLNLSHLLERSVLNLSGGERQRVALARALVVNPRALLLDEPLAALDPNFREQIRRLLKEIHEETGITFLMVTHDFAEALFLGHRAAVINEGAIEQVGTVGEVFRRPASTFVAEFVGMKNVYPARFKGAKAFIGELEIDLDRDAAENHCHLAIRPEDVMIGPDASICNEVSLLSAEVVQLLDAGLFYEAHLRSEGVVLLALTVKSAAFDMGLQPGARVQVGLRRSGIHTF
jgi:molybdate/tungstate transport system ATP-binding protein